MNNDEFKWQNEAKKSKIFTRNSAYKFLRIKENTDKVKRLGIESGKNGATCQYFFN